MTEDIRGIRQRAVLLADAREVDSALDRMATEITRDLGDSDPLVLAVMVGGLMPTAWLLERLDFPLQVDYLHATRYGGGTRGSDTLKWIARPRATLAGRTVLVIDDILDEGLTLSAILDWCRAQDAVRVRSAVFVEKRHSRRPADLRADYTGLQIEDRYLFGCGMDYHEHCRQHREVYGLAAEDERG